MKYSVVHSIVHGVHEHTSWKNFNNKSERKSNYGES